VEESNTEDWKKVRKKERTARKAETEKKGKVTNKTKEKERMNNWSDSVKG
jgi:hypothetical protein